MADEGAVDVDERKDQPAPTGRGPLVAANSHLTPMQEAYSAWSRHLLRCDTCRGVDAGRCDIAEHLYRSYEVLAHANFRRLADGT